MLTNDKQPINNNYYMLSLLRPHQFLHPPIASILKFLDQRLLIEPLMPQLCLGPFIWSSGSGSENTGDPTKFGHGKLV